ncbi:jg23854, partial [Pararge aegeria aegeria]
MFKGNVTIISIAVILCARPLYAKGIETNSIDEEPKNASNTERSGRSLHKECNNGLSAKCLKIHVLSFLEDLSSRDELNLLPGLSIVKENLTNITSPEEIAAELARQFPGKSEEKLNRFLLYRLQSYLDGHSLRYRLLDTKTSEEALNIAKGDRESVGRKKDGGGFGGGKGGGGGALLAAALMMK